MGGKDEKAKGLKDNEVGQSEVDGIVSHVDGVKIYDPRIKKFIVSNNPALIMGDIARNKYFIVDWDTDIYDGNPFWDKIAKMADMCDGASFTVSG